MGALDYIEKPIHDVEGDMLMIAKGGWLKHGCANALVRARLTDAGEGAAYYDEGVRLEPAVAEGAE